MLEYYDANWNQIIELWMSDRTGNSNKIFSFNSFSTNTVEWLNENKIFFFEYSYGDYKQALWLIDVSGAGNHIKISDNYHGLVLSPDKKVLLL